MTVVCAEIPDKDTFPELNGIVTKFMMHGPCSVANPILHAWTMVNVQRSFLRISQKKQWNVMVILSTGEEMMANMF